MVVFCCVPGCGNTSSQVALHRFPKDKAIPYMESYEGAIYYDVGYVLEIIHIHDPSHIRDELVNLFLTNDFHYNIYGGNHIASKRDILECLRLDNKPLISRDLENAALDHGESIGEYYLSAEISKSIGRHIKSEALPPEALGTRLFISLLTEMFEQFNENTHETQVRITNKEHYSEIINFIKSIRLVENKEALIEHSQKPSRVDPRKSKMVRNMKDIDSYINKQKSEKCDDDKNADFQENAKKLEYNLYSEMCNTPDDIQQNPKVGIATASGKTLSASSPADAKKKKRKNLPPEIKKKLIEARLAAAAEVSQSPTTPTKQKGQMGSIKSRTDTKLSSPAKQKTEKTNLGLKVTMRNAAAAEQSKLLTPTKQKVEKNNIESNSEKIVKEKTDRTQEKNSSKPLCGVQNYDSASSSKSSKKRRKRLDSDLNTQQNPEKSESTSTTNNSISTDQITTMNKINNDNIEGSLKDNKSIKENSSIKNFKIPTINTETPIQQPVEDMRQLQVQMDEAIALAYEYNFDDLPELVEDSDQEIETIQDALIMQDIMDEAKAVYEKHFKKNYIGDSAKEEENMNTIKSYTDKDNSEKDDSVEGSKSYVLEKENKDESKANATKDNSGACAVPDLLDTCESTETKATVENPTIEKTENLNSELTILEKNNIDKHNIEDDEIPDFQINPNSIASEVSDLKNDSTSTLSKVRKMLESKDGINDIEIVELPDLIDESDSTFSEMENMNENKANMDRDDTKKLEDIDLIRNNSPVSELEDMDDTNASARSNSIEIDEIPDLVEDSGSSMSSVEYTECIIDNLVETSAEKTSNIDNIEQQSSFGAKDQIKDDSVQQSRSQKDVIQDASDIPQMNTEDILPNLEQYDSSIKPNTSNEELIQDKLLSTEISTGEVRSESVQTECPDSSFGISTPKETDHTYFKLDQGMPNSEATRETLHERNEEKEISVEKSQQPRELAQTNEDEKERKHLSPLQTSDNISPSSGAKKKIKTQVDKIQKLKFDDVSNEENSEKTRLSNSDVTKALINPETVKSESSMTDIEEKERNLKIALGLEKIPNQENATADLKPTDLISKQSMGLLVREYLTEDEIEEILGTKQEVDTTFTLDSVVKYLRESNTQICDKMKSLQKEQSTKKICDKMKSLQKEQSTKNVEPSKPEKNLVKICWDRDTVRFQTVNAGSVEPPPKDPFKKTDLRDIESSLADSNATDNAKAIEGINKEEEDLSDNSIDSIPDFPDEFDDGAWGGLVDEQVKLLADSFGNDIKPGPSNSTPNEVPLPQDEMRKTGAIKKTYLTQPKETATKTEDYKSLLNFRLFVNKLCMYMKEVSTCFYLPYSPEDYLYRAVEESQKFFRERRVIDEKIRDGREVRSLYRKLLRSLLGDRILRTTMVQDSMEFIVMELDELITTKKETNSESGSLDDISVLMRQLWLHNIEGITGLFKQLRRFDSFDELAPDLFTTDHVKDIMRHVAQHSNNPSTYQIENEDCLPLDLRECFDTLKPHGSVLLHE